MFLSIMIPVYNAERFIDKCIQSVISQTSNDFELVLVNDGSTDLSKDKCLAWVDRYPQTIKYVEKENRGPLQTRRTCLEHASGEYLYFMDADDYLVDVEMIDKVKTAIRTYSCDLVFFEAVKSDGRTMFGYNLDNNEVFQDEKLMVLYHYFFNTKKFHHLWNKVFSRELVDWNEDYVSYGRLQRDGIFQIVPILANSKKAVYLDEVFYMYRTENNENSLSHKFDIDFYKSVLVLNKRIYEYSNVFQWQSERLEEYKVKSFMSDISICAIKARKIPNASHRDMLNYLREIGENPFFRKEYSLKNLELFRRPVVFFLYHRMYGVVLLLSNLVGKVKG